MYRGCASPSFASLVLTPLLQPEFAAAQTPARVALLAEPAIPLFTGGDGDGEEAGNDDDDDDGSGSGPSPSDSDSAPYSSEGDEGEGDGEGSSELPDTESDKCSARRGSRLRSALVSPFPLVPPRHLPFPLASVH